MNYKIFSLLFLTGFVALALTVLITALWLEPFDGDLTRISGNSENDYGWTMPQVAFSKNLSRYHENGQNTYQGDEDIVVFGDSFSHIGSTPDTHKYGWQNFLANATNMDIYTYHINKTDIFTWLDDLIPNSKTKYLIYEEVERTFQNHKEFARKCGSTQIKDSPSTPTLIAALPQPEPAQIITRDAASFFKFDDSVHWLKTRIKKNTLSRKLMLTNTDLFTNAKSSEILVFYEDHLLKESSLNSEEEKGIICFFKLLQEKVAAKSEMKLIIGIAPDKTTAYQSYIENISIDKKNHSVFSLLAAQNYQIFRYDLYFRNLVDAGLKDVYLPNDSHWGSLGNRHFASIIKAQMDYEEN